MAEKLAVWGWEVHRGLGGTGVVGTLKRGTSPRRLGLRRACVPVSRTRDIGKGQMRNNCALPKMDVDPQTYEVFADGELLTCEPACELPMAQRYFLL